MKQKQKDDILGEEQSDLPVNEGMLSVGLMIDKGDINGLSISSWRLPERDMRLKESLLLPVTDPKRRRTTHVFLQGTYEMVVMSSMSTDHLQCIECGKQWREY
jgi:hypothetical protein